MSEINLIHLRNSLLALELGDHPVIVHASLKSLGFIQGGAETVVRALTETTAGVLVPTFTYKTMVTPGVGPAYNGMSYGKESQLNSLAEPFQNDMRVDPMIGMLPETLRLHPAARRTRHPILSFAGIRVDEALDSQTLYNPLAPIGRLAEQGGWVILMGTDHTVNTSIHYAEKLAGRKQFTRWALTPKRIVECPGFPGDSDGFEALAPGLESFTRRAYAGGALIRAVPLQPLFEVALTRLRRNPLDLLCQRPDCARCNDIRTALQYQSS